MALGNGLGCHLKSHNVICCLKTFCILQIDLMLGRSNLMVACFHLKAHIFQIEHNISAHIFPKINRGNVKIAGSLMRLGSRPSLFVRVEQEKFTLRSNLERISHIGSTLYSPF